LSSEPLPTFPDGFPPEIIKEFAAATGRKILCNRPYSGTEVIRDFGEEAQKTDALIVYTSADSVFQIAAHEDAVAPETLYDYCRVARHLLQGKYAVGRVIARPFAGTPGNYERTPRRHDFSLIPSEKTILNYLRDHGRETIAVGKIYDIFAGSGISQHVCTTDNDDGMAKTAEFAKTGFRGICFVNLVDFDMKYGHRRDIPGYATAIERFDAWLGTFLETMREGDVLMITADHGCDPGYSGTDHTREYTPLIAYGTSICPVDLGTRDMFSDISATVADLLEVPYGGNGASFAEQIRRTE
jgi:phosphopentomutase